MSKNFPEKEGAGFISPNLENNSRFFLLHSVCVCVCVCTRILFSQNLHFEEASKKKKILKIIYISQSPLSLLKKNHGNPHFSFYRVLLTYFIVSR